MFPSVPRSLLILLCVSLFVSGKAHADEPRRLSSSQLLMQIIDTVVEHHIEAPTRQQMVLDAIRYVAQEQGKVTPPGLSQQVSSADRTALERLLAQAIPRSPISNVSDNRDFDKIRRIVEAIVPGGVSLTSRQDTDLASTHQPSSERTHS